MGIIDMGKVREMAHADDMSIGKIAAYFNVHRYVMSRFLTENGIKIEHPNKQRSAAIVKKPRKNNDLSINDVHMLADKPGSSISRIATSLNVDYHAVQRFITKHSITVEKKTIYKSKKHPQDTSARVSIASLVNQ